MNPQTNTPSTTISTEIPSIQSPMKTPAAAKQRPTMSPIPPKATLPPALSKQNPPTSSKTGSGSGSVKSASISSVGTWVDMPSTPVIAGIIVVAVLTAGIGLYLLYYRKYLYAYFMGITVNMVVVDPVSAAETGMSSPVRTTINRLAGRRPIASNNPSTLTLPIALPISESVDGREQ